MNELIAAFTAFLKKPTIYVVHSHEAATPPVPSLAVKSSTSLGGPIVDSSPATAAPRGRGRPPKATPEAPSAAVSVPVATVAPPAAPLAQAPASTPAPAPVAPVEAKVLTEDESKARAKEVCAKFIQRFNKATPDGLAQARAYVSEKCKKTALTDLDHAERLAFIAWIEGEFAKADAPAGSAKAKKAAPTAAPEPAVPTAI